MLNDLKEKRSSLAAEAKKFEAKILDKSINADETAKFETLCNDVAELDTQIRSLEKLQSINVVNSKPTVAGQIAPAIVEEERAAKPFIATKEYRNAFDKYVRFGREGLNAGEQRDLSKATGAAGSYLVATEFDTQIRTKLTEFNFLRAICPVQQTSTDKNIPLVTDFGDASFIGEKVAVPDDEDPTFGQKTLKAYAMKKIVKASMELVQDSFTDMQATLAMSFGKAFGNRELKAMLVGSGTGEPTGIVTAATKYLNTASATAISFDEIIDAEMEMFAPYRQGAVWVVSSAAVGALRKVKETGTGRYIWNDAVAGKPATLNGKPVYETTFLDNALTAGKVNMVLLNPNYFVIGDRGARSIQVLNEKYADYGLIGYMCWQRIDSQLLDTDAAVKIIQKPS